MGKNDLSIEMLEAEDASASSLALVQHTLSEFDRVEAGLNILRTKFTNVVYPVTTAEGMAQAKAARIEIRTPRYAVDKVAKAAKEPLNALKRDIDARRQSITDELVSLETPIHEQIKVEEDRLAAEKEAKKNAKAEADAKVQKTIDGIRNMALQAVTMNSAQIEQARTALDQQELMPDELGERTGEALQAKMQTLETLDSLHEAALKREADAAQAAADRAELEKIRANQAAQERKELEARQAAEQAERAKRAEADRLAAEQLAADRAAFAKEQADARAALQAQADQLAAQQAELDKAARAEQQRKDDLAAAERAEQARIEREAQAAETARLAALQRQLDEEAAARRAEADRLAAEQRAAEEAAHKADQRGRDSWRVLLAALEGLVNEAQPLGVERPTYQSALSAMFEVTGEKA